MIFSLWDDVEVNMPWLDSAYPLNQPITDPGIKRGDCEGGEESTPIYLRQTYPNAYVTFKNAAVGEIGSTIGPVTPTAPTAPSPNPPGPTPPTSCGSGQGCCSQNFKDCITWCGTSKSECLSCNQDVHWIDCPNQNCLPMYSGCKGNEDGCCDGLTCVVDNPHYSQCRYVENPPTAPDTPSPTVKAPDTPSPTKSPTAAPEGCFSNNYKDCIPDGYSSDDESCNNIWLPNGAQSNCVALWGKCNPSQPNSCCGPAICEGDSNYASCVPDETTTPAPTSQPCTVCDNVGTTKMINKGQDCTDLSSKKLNNNCDKNTWIQNKHCQLSCYTSGNGYDGDVCCNAAA